MRSDYVTQLRAEDIATPIGEDEADFWSKACLAALSRCDSAEAAREASNALLQRRAVLAKMPIPPVNLGAFAEKPV